MDLESLEKLEPQQRKKHYAAVLVVFALVSLVTAIFMNADAGKKQRFTVPADGSGKPHPIEVREDRSVYVFEVRQSTAGMRDNVDWSAVTCEVLDNKGNYLFGFGDEFWSASGYDSDGSWSETKNKYKMKVTFRKKGTYLLDLKTERSNTSAQKPVQVTVTKKAASALPFLWAGIFALVGGVIMAAAANPQMFEGAS